ncbi:U3 snoRNP protein, partial [Spiromyces aspiralis]
AHDAGSGNEQDKSAVADGEQDEGGGNEDEADEEEGRDPVEQADTTHRANHIHTVVVRSLVPEIKKHIFTEDEDKLLARIPLILACTRLLTMLPERTLRLQLPGVLTTLCNLLRSRHLSTRDAARETLLKTISLLGHAYVGFIIKELRSSLQRGYQRHILGYTIHAILNSLQNEVAVGSLDYTLDPIVSILCDDMFGETAQEKEASEKTGKIKEAQSNRAVDAFSILAKIVDLRHLGQLLAPLRDLLRETEATKVTRKVDAVLQAISQGVNANTEFDVPVVLTFCHGLIYQYSNMTQKAKEEAEQLKKRKELKAKLRADMEETYKIVNAPTELLTSRNYLAMNAHRFVEFGLNLVSLALKKRHFDVHDPEQLSMLNPFVDVAGNCLFLRYDSIVVSSLRILTALVKMPLPAFKCGVPVMVKRVFKILQDVPNTQSPTVHACFRLLISILRSSTCKDYAEITPKQLTFLVDFLRPDLEAPDRQATIFGLIRTIMLKKLMADAIYDLADTIKELMVTAQSSHTRSLCRQTWLHFMMEYPLGERRIKAAIAFLVQNAANYEFESGRESAMEAMSDMMQKFTDELFLPNAAEPFFFTLVVVLSSDDSNRCRQVAATLTRVLLTRMDAPRLGAVTAALKKWSDEILRIEGAAMPELEGSGDGTSASAQQKRLQLALTSLQVYGLLAEALEDRCKKRVPDILGAVHSALQVSLQCWKRLEKNEAEKYTSHTIFADNVGADSGGYPVSTSPSRLNWEMAYFAMNAFSKLVKAYPAGLFGPKQSGIWWLVVNHLNHPHLWIRMTSSRLLGQYFAESNPDWITQASGDCPQVALEEDPATDTPKLPSFNGPPKHVLMTFASIRTIAAKLLVQLKGKVLSDELAAQIVKNLFFVGKCLYKLAKPGKSDSADHSSPGSGDNSDDDDNGNNNEVASGNAEQDQQETVKLDPAQSLSWLIRKVAGVAKLELDQERTRTTRRTACFRWFAALSTAVEADYLIGQLVTILSPMYRTVEDEQVYHGAKKTQNDELRELGRELMTLIQKKVGTSAYFVAHNEIRTKIDKVRQERREKRKLLAITDPELHANRKLKRNKAKAESKKRRCEGNIKSKIRVAVARNRDGEL